MLIVAGMWILLLLLSTATCAAGREDAALLSHLGGTSPVHLADDKSLKSNRSGGSDKPTAPDDTKPSELGTPIKTLSVHGDTGRKPPPAGGNGTSATSLPNPPTDPDDTSSTSTMATPRRTSESSMTSTTPSTTTTTTTTTATTTSEEPTGRTDEVSEEMPTTVATTSTSSSAETTPSTAETSTILTTTKTTLDTSSATSTGTTTTTTATVLPTTGRTASSSAGPAASASTAASTNRTTSSVMTSTVLAVVTHPTAIPANSATSAVSSGSTTAPSHGSGRGNGSIGNGTTVTSGQKDDEGKPGIFWAVFVISALGVIIGLAGFIVAYRKMTKPPPAKKGDKIIGSRMAMGGEGKARSRKNDKGNDRNKGKDSVMRSKEGKSGGVIREQASIAKTSEAKGGDSREQPARNSGEKQSD